MRLVDLDAVIDCLEVEWGYEGIREDLYSLPVVDAVPVVRCKDCEYSDDEISYLCCSNGVCADCEVPSNFYCAYGKRRAENEK